MEQIWTLSLRIPEHPPSALQARRLPTLPVLGALNVLCVATTQELADVVGLPPQEITQALQHLMALGYVTRDLEAAGVPDDVAVPALVTAALEQGLAQRGAR